MLNPLISLTPILNLLGKKSKILPATGWAVEDFGIPLAEVARQVGVSTSAISKALNKTMKD